MANTDILPWYRTREAQNKYNLKYKRTTLYGLMGGEWEAILEYQNNACAVCGTQEPGGRTGKWHTDHDHGCCSGRGSCGWCVRGLLCHCCNYLEVGVIERAVKAGRLKSEDYPYFQSNWTHHRKEWLNGNP